MLKRDIEELSAARTEVCLAVYEQSKAFSKIVKRLGGDYRLVAEVLEVAGLRLVLVGGVYDVIPEGMAELDDAET